MNMSFVGFLFILFLFSFSWSNFLILFLGLEGIMMFIYYMMMGFMGSWDMWGEYLLLFLVLMVISGAYGLALLINLTSSLGVSLKLGIYT